MKQFSVKELMNLGCSKSFALEAAEYPADEHEDGDAFIARIENVFKVEEQDGVYGSAGPENAGISNGQMQVEHDYEGNVLNYHGYTWPRSE
jgi:hypothetical protein